MASGEPLCISVRFKANRPRLFPKIVHEDKRSRLDEYKEEEEEIIEIPTDFPGREKLMLGSSVERQVKEKEARSEVGKDSTSYAM